MLSASVFSDFCLIRKDPDVAVPAFRLPLNFCSVIVSGCDLQRRVIRTQSLKDDTCSAYQRPPAMSFSCVG